MQLLGSLLVVLGAGSAVVVFVRVVRDAGRARVRNERLRAVTRAHRRELRRCVLDGVPVDEADAPGADAMAHVLLAQRGSLAILVDGAVIAVGLLLTVGLGSRAAVALSALLALAVVLDVVALGVILRQSRAAARYVGIRPGR